MLKWTLTKRPITPNQQKPKKQIRHTPPKHRRSYPIKPMKMPTRTRISTTLERSLHRKSLDANIQSSKRVRSPDSNKENMGIHFLRSPMGNTSLLALHDLSNGRSPKRPATPMPTLSSLGMKQNLVSKTLPSFEAETYTPIGASRFSDNFDEHPLSRLSFKPRKSKTSPEESLSSSRMGDETLDKMLDDIIKSTRKDTNNVTIKDYDLEQSIHEMEVRTPPHLKRQRVVVRRRPRPKPEMIGLTLPNGIPSPETPKANSMDKIIADDLANMETPKSVVIIVDSLPENLPKDMQQQHCSTPTQEQTHSIKRCLTFSPDSDDDFNVAKRSSVASSNISEGSSSCTSRAGPAKGSLDLAIFVENNRLSVHVIRCRELQRPNGSSVSINAYVKVALMPCDDVSSEIGFQRTAVHRHSSRPYFDHRFMFDIKSDDEHDLAMARIQLTVWHRDRDLKRSEFLGCMSFPLRSVILAPVNGSYKLQSQSCLNSPSPAIPVINPVNSTSTNTALSAAANMTSAEKRAGPVICQKSVEEDVISIDSLSAANLNLIDPNSNQPITLSKKAIHQRDADENLFLRFLELDPPTEVPASTSAGTGSTGGRRLSSAKPTLGRTPFTVTKKLTRTVERGFGFSIVWTHPPRVEKIEPGLSADKNGILPGDYVIFVDKHNVVTMPEADVLNLIRSQGNTLTMEVFRRSGSSASSAAAAAAAAAAVPSPPTITTRQPVMMNGVGSKSRVTSAASNYTDVMPVGSNVRPSTACSSSSTMEAAKRRLNLPQVTFSKESIAPITDNRRRFLLQLISREQNFVSSLHFGMQRFVQPLIERKDLISPNDHRTLFQNIDELLRISEDILEQLMHDDQEPQLNFTSRVYISKTTAICAAYKKYCNGIKRADCVLVNKSRQAGSEFVAFITEPQVPRKRPDLTMFIHRPLQHFREILKLMQMLASNCHVDSEEHKNFTSVINELQAAYREITVSSGLMEPLGEGRPLLTLQDLEARMVFTKCKPFTLAVQGRQWIFGGDLSRVEGRSVKPYWTLLFSDIIVFAKVSRDRVLFITEEPIPIANIVDSCFHMRKKTAEFRITVDPNGRLAESPTGYCAPDLTRTPKKSARRKSLILRAPSLELKAVWQNLLQRQIFLVNAALGSTPLSSPLDSPDVLNTLVPLSDIGMTTASMASIKLSSMDSITVKNQQLQQSRCTNPSEQFEMLIDEKCRILKKTGTPRSSALHLAKWMKGQLDKQQEEARLAVLQSGNIHAEDEHLYQDVDSEERITYWTRAQLEKRTKELNLAKECCSLRPKPFFGGKRLSGVEELSMDDNESDVKSPSRSTTSDSQITVRSSPVANVGDKLSVCRHCHKNCQQLQQSSSTSPSNLICNSLKVQHSQASPNRCCRLNGVGHSSISSTSTSTVTGGGDREPSPTATKPQSPSLIPAADSKSIVFSGVRVLGDEEPLERLPNGHCSSEEDKYSSESPAPAPITASASALTSVSVSVSVISAAAETTPKKHMTPPPKPNRHSIKEKSFKKTSPNRQHGYCNCDCTLADFAGTTISPDELTQETCKLIEPKNTPKVTPTRIASQKSPTRPLEEENNNPHQFCKCICKDRPSDGDDDLSLMLIGLAQLTPTAKLIHADTVAFVPSIAVVPPTPTPDAMLSKTTTNIWDNTTSVITSTATKLLINNVPRQAVIENIPEDSADESPIDDEPPYRPMNSTSLRRYGTLSSLEKLPSEDRPDPDNRSSDGDDPPEELEDDNDIDPQRQDTESQEDEIEVVTKEIFNTDASAQIPWASRAGSFVAGKMSFFEESRAFIDKYLGRWNQEHQNIPNNDDDQVDDCTSGATSGEEVWGTPTSGGDNDDVHLNSENTQSSPTKSSTSLNDDDDTELMMDELLMAPPMTASTIRGLLPRRRLEPLFEEETESDEEKTQQESEELKKGETTTNGRILKDSIGSSSDEETEEEEQDELEREEEEEEEKEKEEDLQNQKLQSQLESESNVLDGRRSLTRDQQQPVPMPLPQVAETEGPSSANTSTTTATTTTTTAAATTRLIQMTSSSLMTTMTMTMTTTMTAMNSSTSIITSSVSGNTMPMQKKLPMQATRTINTNSCETTLRKTKTSPPPPPPRRLLLTQTNLRNAQAGKGATTQQPVQPSSGVTADTGSSVDVAVDSIHKRFTQINQRAVFNTKSCAGNTGPAASRQSTIIETSLLGPAAKKPVSISSTTVSTTTITTTTTTTTTITTATTVIAEAARSSSNSSTNGSPTTVHHGSALSPRLEMRLALNHDILGDEDLISYDPGPDLTTILGHDLSTFHRLTGRDLLTRTATNRVQPKEAVISFCQQRNSKMDTPTVNRRPRPVSVGGDCVVGATRIGSNRQHLQPNRNTWSSSAFATASDLIEQINTSANENIDASYRNTSTNSDESKLSDLEMLAKREKMYFMSQSKSGLLVRTTTKTMESTGLMRTRSTSSVASAAATMETDQQRGALIAASSGIGRTRKLGRDETGLIEAGKGNRLRNSEVPLSKNCSRTSLNESNPSSTPERSRRQKPHQQLSPRKDNDKPSLNRRLWKQITKRRRANSVSELVAS